MPVPTSPEPTRKWRLALLLLAVALIVVVPAILLWTASMDSMRAMEQVNHSQQVEAQSYALTYDLRNVRSEEHTSELQSLMRISYAVFCLKKKQTAQHCGYTYPRKQQDR